MSDADRARQVIRSHIISGDEQSPQFSPAKQCPCVYCLLITSRRLVTHDQVQMTPMTFLRSWGQRSRSGIDGHRHGLYCERDSSWTRDFSQNLHIGPTSYTQAANRFGFQGNRCKGQGRRNVFRWRRFAVEDRLVYFYSLINFYFDVAWLLVSLWTHV